MKIPALYLCLLSVVFVFCGCLANQVEESYRPLTLPDDEALHNSQTEWWYFNVHLTANEHPQKRWALHQVLFQIHEASSGRTLYVAQGALADVELKTYLTTEKIKILPSLPLKTNNGFDFNLFDWSIAGINGNSYILESSFGESKLHLTLTSYTDPVLHGNGGIVQLGPAGPSYYYSRPRLKAEGALVNDHGVAVQVSGLGWMDKQWGNFKPSLIGWDWANVQLYDGTNIMVARILDSDNSKIDEYGSLSLGADFTHLSQGQFSFGRLLQNNENVWVLKIPGSKLELILTPLIQHSQFKSKALGIEYWESAVEVKDEQERVLGQGFIEITRPIAQQSNSE